MIGGFRAVGGSVTSCVNRSVRETSKLNGLNPSIPSWKAAIATASRRYALPMGLRAIKSKKYNPIGTIVFVFLIMSLTVAFGYSLFA